MNPRKITACIRPGFHSRATMRDCRKPLTSTARKRASGWSQRTSGASFTTMASLRHASAPNPASATASNSVIAIGFTKALAAARLLQGQDPVHQILDVGVGGQGVRRHGRLAPDMRAALLDLVPEHGCRVLVAFVLDGNVLECGTDEFLVDLVTRGAAILFHHRFRSGVVQRGMGAAGNGRADPKRNPMAFHLRLHSEAKRAVLITLPPVPPPESTCPAVAAALPAAARPRLPAAVAST